MKSLNPNQMKKCNRILDRNRLLFNTKPKDSFFKGFDSKGFLSNTRHRRGNTRGYFNDFPSVVWDWDDNFTSYDQTAFDAQYITNDTGEMRGNPTTDLILLSVTGSVSNNQNIIYSDIFGGVISDTAWVLKRPIQTTTLTTATTPYYLGMFNGMSDNTSDAATSNDFAGIAFKTISSTNTIYSSYKDGAALGNPATNGQAFTHAWTTETNYIATIRLSSTSLENSLSSTSAYSKDVETQTQTIASSVINLRYWKGANYDNAAAGQITQNMLANLQFKNAVTSFP